MPPLTRPSFTISRQLPLLHYVVKDIYGRHATARCLLQPPAQSVLEYPRIKQEPNLYNFIYALRELYEAETDPRTKKIYGLIIDLAGMTQRELVQTANTIEDLAARIQE